MLGDRTAAVKRRMHPYGVSVVGRRGARMVPGMDGDQALSAFIRDNELAWLHGTVPAEFS